MCCFESLGTRRHVLSAPPVVVPPATVLASSALLHIVPQAPDAAMLPVPAALLLQLVPVPDATLQLVPLPATHNTAGTKSHQAFRKVKANLNTTRQAHSRTRCKVKKLKAKLNAATRELAITHHKSETSRTLSREGSIACALRVTIGNVSAIRAGLT